MKCLVFLIAVVSVYSDKCLEGPRYWCKSYETAKECGAINFCKMENAIEQPKKELPNEETAYHEERKEFKLDAAPVNVTLYYESLCPSCKQIIMYQIWPAYNKLMSTGILNVNFVPYGNAQQRKYGNNWVFYCQHGQAECLGNMLESCAMYHYPKPAQYMPFLHCMEQYQPTLRTAQYCASLAKIEYNAIYSCAYSEEGNKIEHQMGEKTEALNPRHQYVPWFTMNEYHSSDIQNELSTNFLNYVCQTYRGTKPSECYAAKELSVCKRAD